MEIKPQYVSSNIKQLKKTKTQPIKQLQALCFILILKLYDIYPGQVAHPLHQKIKRLIPWSGHLQKATNR